MSNNSFADASEEAVVQALSARSCAYDIGNIQELEAIAGGEEALVDVLLKYRDKEKPPFVGIRSEKLLLNYTDRSDVIEALESDVANPNLFGLARVVSVHIDEVQNVQARRRLAIAVLQRANQEQRFRSYGRLLLESQDAEIQRNARQQLE